MTTRNDAGFYAPLKTSLVPTNGSGAPTLTRSTAAWVFDNEDKLIAVPASAAAFGGARMVRNLLASPDVLSTQGVTTIAATYTISFYGTGSVAFSGTYAGASLAGTGVSDRVQRTFTATAGTLTLTITGSVTNAQLENVTGQTDQTASEYVSGDNGAGVNNLKWLATNKDGSAIPEQSLLGLAANPNAVTNTMLYCRDFAAGAIANKWMMSTSGAELVTNSTFDTDASGWTTFNVTPSVSSGQCTLTATGNNCYLSRAFTTEVGVMYKASCQMVSDAMTGNNFLKVGTVAGSANVGSSIMIVATNTLNFVATATTTYISVSGGVGVTGQNFVIDNLGCKKADVQPALTQTGLDNAANSCSLLTATAANATILQTITAAAAAGCTGWRVTRAVGTGNIYITRDGGTNWTDITSLINSDTPTLVGIENTSVLNPVVGFKFGTSGDAIIVDGGLNHLGTKLYPLPIITTSAAITVGAQTLTYPTTGNISDTAGTILATVNQDAWSDGGVVGSTTRGLFSSTANKGAQSKDGTNTVNGPTGTPSGEERIGMRWSGSSMQSYSDAEFGAAGSYDGALNLSTISIMSGIQGYVRDVAIWLSSLADADMIEASGTVNILGTPATISISESAGNMLIGNVINGVADQILMTCPDGLVIAGRTIDGVADTITITQPAGSVLFDNAPRSTVTINGLYAQKTITAKL